MILPVSSRSDGKSIQETLYASPYLSSYSTVILVQYLNLVLIGEKPFDSRADCTLLANDCADDSENAIKPGYPLKIAQSN